ncbi:AMP-binding enzyme family protein [Mycobacterium kansasii]|uniref:AMP-binding enzyme family protein n=1 Tax=Mycobacterium kansasii TaxID=1768 RepID=A0A1V3W8T4_MYCKA|nr:AMP-binding enzyme family protein [Mycobacterium kansasii]
MEGELASSGLAVDVPRLSARRGPVRKCFSDGLYLTGDLAKKDADGYFWFVGRKDDVIKSPAI